MARLVQVAVKGDLVEGGGKMLLVEGRRVALFRAKDKFYAMESVCLHRGGPLGEGEMHGHLVTCPWHGWTYDVRTGSLTIIPTLKVKTYPVKVEGDAVFIEI